MFILYEKYVNPDSFWKPYIRIMPSTFDTIAYYSEEEMALLKVSPRAFRKFQLIPQSILLQKFMFK